MKACTHKANQQQTPSRTAGHDLLTVMLGDTRCRDPNFGLDPRKDFETLQVTVPGMWVCTEVQCDLNDRVVKLTIRQSIIMPQPLSVIPLCHPV